MSPLRFFVSLCAAASNVPGMILVFFSSYDRLRKRSSNCSTNLSSPRIDICPISFSSFCPSSLPVALECLCSLNAILRGPAGLQRMCLLLCPPPFFLGHRSALRFAQGNCIVAFDSRAFCLDSIFWNCFLKQDDKFKGNPLVACLASYRLLSNSRKTPVPAF